VRDARTHVFGQAQRRRLVVAAARITPGRVTGHHLDRVRHIGLIRAAGPTVVERQHPVPAGEPVDDLPISEMSNARPQISTSGSASGNPCDS
jgi:hypothetical protein